MNQDDGFADVLNGLTLSGGRRKRKKEPEPPPARPDVVEGGQGFADRAAWSWTIPSSAPVVVPASAPVTDEDLGDAAIVRPYAWTGGRTKSTVDLQIETMVSTGRLPRSPRGWRCRAASPRCCWATWPGSASSSCTRRPPVVPTKHISC